MNEIVDDNALLSEVSNVILGCLVEKSIYFNIFQTVEGDVTDAAYEGIIADIQTQTMIEVQCVNDRAAAENECIVGKANAKINYLQACRDIEKSKAQKIARAEELKTKNLGDSATHSETETSSIPSQITSHKRPAASPHSTLPKVFKRRS